MKLYGIEVEPSGTSWRRVKECSFCARKNSPDAKFCNECNDPLDAIVAESSDKRFRKQSKLTRRIEQKLINSREVQRLGEARSVA